MRQHSLPTLPNFTYKTSGQSTILQPDGTLHPDQEPTLLQSQHPTTASPMWSCAMGRSWVVPYFFAHRFCRECWLTMPAGDNIELASQGGWQPSQVFKGCVHSKEGSTAAITNHFRKFHPELCPSGVSTTRTVQSVQRSDKMVPTQKQVLACSWEGQTVSVPGDWPGKFAAAAGGAEIKARTKWFLCYIIGLLLFIMAVHFNFVNWKHDPRPRPTCDWSLPANCFCSLRVSHGWSHFPKAATFLVSWWKGKNQSETPLLAVGCIHAQISQGY